MTGTAAAIVLGAAVTVSASTGWMLDRRPRVAALLLAGFFAGFMALVLVLVPTVDLD